MASAGLPPMGVVVLEPPGLAVVAHISVKVEVSQVQALGRSAQRTSSENDGGGVWLACYGFVFIGYPCPVEPKKEEEKENEV
jgi:hypothetical protein